jgi:branched-chain amino acid transport system substrate-binding protein
MLAFDGWNNRKGLLGYRLEPALYDADCSFASADQAARQAAADGIQFLIGPLCSEAAIAAALPAEAAKMLMISPTAMHPLVSANSQGETRLTVFNISYGYELQGRVAALFARNSLKLDKAALLSQAGNDYTTSLTGAFARNFLAEGGQIVYQVDYSPGAEDFTEILTAVHQSGAAFIYLPAPPAIVNRVARQLNELNLSPSARSTDQEILLLGSDSWESTDLDLAAVENSFFPVHYSPAVDRPLVRQWVESYKSANSVEPNTLAALGYDAANILAGAIDQANTLEPMAIAHIMEQTEFEGITGPIRFDPAHNPVKPVPFVQIRDQRLKYLISITPD